MKHYNVYILFLITTSLCFSDDLNSRTVHMNSGKIEFLNYTFDELREELGQSSRSYYSGYKENIFELPFKTEIKYMPQKNPKMLKFVVEGGPNDGQMLRVTPSNLREFRKIFFSYIPFFI